MLPKRWHLHTLEICFIYEMRVTEGTKLIETIKHVTLFETNVYMFMHYVTTVEVLVHLMKFSWGRNSASFLIHRILAGICLSKCIFFPKALLEPQWLYQTELLTFVIIIQGPNHSNRAHCFECNRTKSLGQEEKEVSESRATTLLAQAE